MSFTAETLDNPIPSAVQNSTPGPLPSREFIGYDPNGTTTITGTDRSLNLKQSETIEGREAQASPPQEESVTLSPKVSAIARREQAQRQREAALKQREADLADKLADAEKFKKLQERIAAKDYGAADELGLKYDEYTDHLVKQQADKNPQEERTLKLERELAEFKKSQEEQTQRDYEANQKLWKVEITRTISADEELTAFETRAKENGLLEDGASFADLILQHINDSFEEDDIELTAEQAATEIKEALKDRAKKFSSMLGNVTFEAPAKRLGAPKTITQNMTVSSQKPVKKPFHLMSEAEQIAEAYRRVQEAKQQR